MAEELLGGLVLPYHIILMRMVGAALLCAVIGFEREAGQHSAGLRTHMLIGVGAASFALLTVHVVEMFADKGDAVRLDPIRLIEAATSGVAFLAAGMIVLARGRVRNLTTGAGLWVAAAIGVACGLGLWPIAATGAVLGLLIVGLLRVVSKGDEDDEPI